MRVLEKDGDKIIVNEFPRDKISFTDNSISVGEYTDVFMAFDIETTLIDYCDQPNAIMYLWQVAIGRRKVNVYVGRTWSDFVVFLECVRKYYHLSNKMKMVVYVHNLAYEFQFLRSVLKVNDIFALKKRVPLKVTMNDCFEFRCSYKLSNMALKKFALSENAKHLKQENFDYDKERFPDTNLSDDELYYGVCDVLALHESVCSISKHEKDNIATIPLTSTGYVRREARKAVQSNKDNYFAFIDKRLNAHQYKLCKDARRGGNVHANPLYVNSILNSIDSWDKSSSYPFQMLSSLFPAGKFIEERAKQVVKDAANLMLVYLENVEVRSNVYFPYIPASKCIDLNYRESRFDNGRVLYAPSFYLTITEIDYYIIKRQYKCKVTIVEQYVAGLEYLNKDYRDYVYEMYKIKCELKNKDEYFYAKYKNKINATFGMMLTDITREEITYTNNCWGSDLPSVVDALNDYYKSHNSFLSYQDGVYVTAHARSELQEALDVVGIDGVYADTDSCKCIGDHESDFINLNVALREKFNKSGYQPVTVDGVVYVMGEWERDAFYERFVTQGAKKYAYLYSGDSVNGKHANHYGVTVAGLNKSKGTKVIERLGLESFLLKEGETEGIIFSEVDSGRMTAVYNDDVGLKKVCFRGHDIEITSNMALIPTTYQLTHTKEYSDYISEIKKLNI